MGDSRCRRVSAVVLAMVVSTEAAGVTIVGAVVDDNGNTFEGDIDAIAVADITRGCNPPTNSRFCPDDNVDRGQMAAFLHRALDLPNANTDFFTDDDNSIFEADINAIAEAGITRGCNPPANSRFCPGRGVSRGEMAAFLRRALNLPSIVHRIPLGGHSAMDCSKDGERCSLNVDLSAGRQYQVQEGLFQVNDPSPAEQDQFGAARTTFSLTLDGSEVSLDELNQQSGGGVTNRYWLTYLSFPSGTHTLVGRWRWDGQLIQTSTVTIRASG